VVHGINERAGSSFRPAERLKKESSFGMGRIIHGATAMTAGVAAIVLAYRFALLILTLYTT
jgi:hypothetical protein